MNNFQVGDVVVCVDATPRGRSPYGDSLQRLKVRSLYRVMQALIDNYGDAAVLLESPRSSHPDGIWQANRFRKVKTADEQFTAQIRACKPVPALATGPQS